MENTEKKQGMYLKDALKFLGISRTTFYTYHFNNLTVTKDSSGYRNIFLKEEIDAIKEKLNSGIEIVKS
jgi:ACT domain-containing protein